MGQSRDYFCVCVCACVCVCVCVCAQKHKKDERKKKKVKKNKNSFVLIITVQYVFNSCISDLRYATSLLKSCLILHLRLRQALWCSWIIFKRQPKADDAAVFEHSVTMVGIYAFGQSVFGWTNLRCIKFELMFKLVSANYRIFCPPIDLSSKKIISGHSPNFAKT